MLRLPGLIDLHVHMREPGAIHKEDWQSGTSAALAGGVTLVLAMPNTQPPVTDAQSLRLALDAARQKALCDYAQYLGATPDNADVVAELAPRAAGLKMYLDHTYGPLRLANMTDWMVHLARWPREIPLAVHAEGRTLAAVILLASFYDHPVHLCHVSRREEILIIRAAKERGLKVTCEVTPHHLFLSEEDIPALGQGRAEVRPALASPADRQALWDNLEVIDCFATDHAPHTLAEKNGPTPPPGFPGLETALPLFLTAVSEERLTLDDVVQRYHVNPQRIFRLPSQPETWVEVDTEATWEIQATTLLTRAAWTPFEGWRVRGRVVRVVVRGTEAFRDGKVLVPPGFGRNVREVSG
ncbi:amidohydrolase family protein [uncultured Thermanaerothrix sp.]|uniref:amidohydrolase family protein n=1 Tax=uncultured Thermanaerothrix sp. TaxID=1195149 RepID=UPI00260E059C|nr:amidohydrolase family protein [uncultured Thermanaerothrix sp.]